jgi:hypothetical protein
VAALAVASPRRPRDLDLLCVDRDGLDLRAVQQQIELAARRLAPPDLRDVKGFMPGPDADPRPIPDIPGIEVTTTSPRYLLAMKLMAMRFGEDDQDIEILRGECDIHSAQEALDLLSAIYPLAQPPAKTRFFLEETLGSKPGV